MILNFNQREIIRCYPDTLYAKKLLLALAWRHLIRDIKKAYVPCRDMK